MKKFNVEKFLFSIPLYQQQQKNMFLKRIKKWT